MALKILLVRVDLAGISCVLGMTEEMVLACLRRAAFKAQEINTHTYFASFPSHRCCSTRCGTSLHVNRP